MDSRTINLCFLLLQVSIAGQPAGVESARVRIRVSVDSFLYYKAMSVMLAL